MSNLKATREHGYYTISGIRRPSVTTVIHSQFKSEGLRIWKERNKNWKDIAERAALRGTLMHRRILGEDSEQTLEMDELPMDRWYPELGEELEGMDRAWESLGIAMEPPILTEYTVWYDGEMPFAGTIDRRAKIGGRLAILDLKSSKKPQETHRIQMGAYYLALLQRGMPTERAFIPYIRPDDADLIEMEKDELVEESERFLVLLQNFYEKEELKRS